MLSRDEIHRIALDCINVCDGIVTIDSDQRRGCLEQIKSAIQLAALSAVADRVELDSAELAELRRDAERFRWLREGHCGHVSVSVSEQEFGPGVHGNELDAAVDAARERADG